MSIISGADLAVQVGVSDGGDSATLAAAAAAACRNVRGWCGRSFEVVTAATAASARYFHVLSATDLFIDDCTEITAVATDASDAGSWATSLTTADYYAAPVGGVASDGSTGWPYTSLLGRNGYRFPTTNVTIPAVKVTAKWGWSSLPDDVRLATLMVGAELWRAKGGSVETFTADGQFIPIRRNALVRDLLRDYRGWRSAPAVA